MGETKPPMIPFEEFQKEFEDKQKKKNSLQGMMDKGGDDAKRARRAIQKHAKELREKEGK